MLNRQGFRRFLLLFECTIATSGCKPITVRFYGRVCEARRKCWWHCRLRWRVLCKSLHFVVFLLCNYRLYFPGQLRSCPVSNVTALWYCVWMWVLPHLIGIWVHNCRTGVRCVNLVSSEAQKRALLYRSSFSADWLKPVERKGEPCWNRENGRRFNADVAMCSAVRIKTRRFSVIQATGTLLWPFSPSWKSMLTSCLTIYIRNKPSTCFPFKLNWLSFAFVPHSCSSRVRKASIEITSFEIFEKLTYIFTIHNFIQLRNICILHLKVLGGSSVDYFFKGVVWEKW